MRLRDWLLIVVMGVELFLMIFCLAKKSNHTTIGYVCSGLSLIMLVVTTCLMMFPHVDEYKPTGKYTVAYKEDFYVDNNRLETYKQDGSYRELNVGIWYPANIEENQSCPILFFSHGSFGVKESNLTLFKELASQGYYMCSINHTYQCFSTKTSNHKTIKMSQSYMHELMSDNVHKNPTLSYERMKKWMEIRTGDISFIIDNVLEKENANKRVINNNDIFVMGHSLGGSAALGIGRLRTDVKAVISLEAPYMCDIQGMNGDEFIFNEEEYPVPVLHFYSDSSWNHLREWKQYKQNVRYLETTDKVTNIHISGIGHMALTDFSRTSPFLTMCLDGRIEKGTPESNLKKINDETLKFLNAHLL